MSERVKVKFMFCRPGLLIPARGTPESTGYDLQTAVAVHLKPGEGARLPTGVKLGFPPGYAGQIRPRSSASGASLLVHLGTVDNDYRGEVQINVTNVSAGPLYFQAGARLAQLVIEQKIDSELDMVGSESDLGPPTQRGERGFGSTGA